LKVARNIPVHAQAGVSLNMLEACFHQQQAKLIMVIGRICKPAFWSRSNFGHGSGILDRFRATWSSGSLCRLNGWIWKQGTGTNGTAGEGDGTCLCFFGPVSEVLVD